MAIDISIIATNWNGGREPVELLDSIAKLDYPKAKIETIIVDNGSTDKSPDVVEKKYPWARLIRLRRNLGFPGGVNIGITNAHGKYLFIANDDLVLSRPSARQMIERFNTNPRLGVLGGKTYFKLQPEKVSATGFKISFFTGKIAPETATPMWVSGCALMIPRRVIDKVGLFDEGFSPGYFEDADLCMRVRQAGYKIAYDPDIIFFHGHNKSFAKLSRWRYLWYWQKAKLRFMYKYALNH